MSEYVSKKAVLEWLKEQQKKQEENRDRLEIDHPYWEYHEGASNYLSLAVEKFESGAFDVPEPTYPSPDAYEAACKALRKHRDEVQHLRAVLDGIRQYLMLIPNKTVTDQRTIEICNEALSTSTGAQQVREPVRWFAEQMEEKLRANDHKPNFGGRWKGN
jgi:hypothetical protein